MNSRLTYVGTACYTRPDGKAITIDTRYARILATADELVILDIVATEEWKPIPHGWLEHASLLTISNEEGKGLQRRPTPEEEVDIQKRVIEVGVFYSCTDCASEPEVLDLFEVYPREGMPGYRPTNFNLAIRCRKGTAKCVVAWFPR